MNMNLLNRIICFWLVPGLLLCVGLTSCRSVEEDFSQTEESPYASPDEDEEDPRVLAERAAVRRAAYERGRSLYNKTCATCHGSGGDGQGPSAAGLEPKPRDFREGIYKWRSTESGSLPLDRDIYRTISDGVPGTMMVAWKDLLSPNDRWALIEYIKRFTDRFEEEGVTEEEIIEVPEPVASTPELVARGAEVFEASKCWECHGRSGIGDGPSAHTLKDTWGHPIKPFDFTTGQFRGGGSDRDIYRTFFTGLNGTPMPAFADTIAAEDRWPLVHYIRSLQRELDFFEYWLLHVPSEE